MNKIQKFKKEYIEKETARLSSVIKSTLEREILDLDIVDFTIWLLGYDEPKSARDFLKVVNEYLREERDKYKYT